MPQPLHERPCLSVGVPHVEHAGPRPFVPQKDVVGDGEAVDDVEILVHRGDPVAQRRGGVGNRDALALPNHLATVGGVHSGEDLDERGLARAVLPEDAVRLAGSDDQVDTLERRHPGERPSSRAGARSTVIISEM
ncbi:MAG: hypothetical protein JWM51_1158 [Microbacteriaceae bacterium]|nr:hypothetical protein [Microbacteriaceae bacterium]